MKSPNYPQKVALRHLEQRAASGKEWSTAADICAQAKTLRVLERLGRVEGRPKEERRFAADKDCFEWRLKK